MIHQEGGFILNVRISLGVHTFVIAAFMILTLVQAVHASDWPMLGHDAARSGVTDEILNTPLELLWQSFET